MNPELRTYMYPHYGTGYKPYPYGIHMGYGSPLSLYYHYHPHYHPHHMIHHHGGSSGATFAVPIQAPVRQQNT